MKILLINPPDDLQSFLGNGQQFVPVLEPMGLLSIGTVLKSSGYDVEVLDAFAMKLSLEEVQSAIANKQPDVIGLTSFISNGEVVYALGRWIKQNLPNIFVVLGNTHAFVYAEAYLQCGCCDCVIQGEGEEVFIELLKVLGSHGKLSDIPSISFLKDGQYVAARECAIIEDLTKLPVPDREMLEQRYYNFPNITNMPYSYRQGRIAKHMFTSRGCPFRCSFCAVQKGQKRRTYSLAQVMEEIRLLTGKYKAQYIFFMDPIFVFDKKRVIDLCRTIRSEGLKFRWGCEGHVNCIDEELVKEMELAGCHDMAFGIESGVQRILDSVNKGTRLANIEQAVNLIKQKTNIKIAGLFILGLPSETYQDSLATIAFSQKLSLDMAQFSIFVPYPGSPLYFDLAKKGEISTGVKPDGTLDTSVWQRYSSYVSFSGKRPIWVTPGLTAEQLVYLQKKAMRDFYFRPWQFWFQLQRLSFRELAEACSAFMAVVGVADARKQ